MQCDCRMGRDLWKERGKNSEDNSKFKKNSCGSMNKILAMSKSGAYSLRIRIGTWNLNNLNYLRRTISVQPRGFKSFSKTWGTNYQFSFLFQVCVWYVLIKWKINLHDIFEFGKLLSSEIVKISIFSLFYQELYFFNKQCIQNWHLPALLLLSL